MKEIKILFFCISISVLSFGQSIKCDNLEYKTYLAIKMNNYSDVRNDITAFFYPISNTSSLDLMFLLNDFKNRIVLSQDRCILNDLNYNNSSQLMIDSLNSIFKSSKIIYSTAKISLSMVFINAKIETKYLKREHCAYMNLNFIKNKLEISYEEVKGITLLTKLIF
jgi:hypothetical protein